MTTIASDSTMALNGSLFKAKTDSDIITGTLNTLNSTMYGSGSHGSDAMSTSYNFQKDVLSAAYTERGVGAIFNSCS